jgi:GDP-mannose 6-dehydrogenase
MKLDNVVRPLLEQKSGKEEGKDFGICMNPEFMRESTAIHDFYHPLFTIIGTCSDRAAERVAATYSSLTAPVERTSILVAELIKSRRGMSSTVLEADQRFALVRSA